MTTALALVAQKLATARRVLASEGIVGFGKEMAQKPPLLWFRKEFWTLGPRWPLGALVVLAGNRVRVEGCRFSVAHPAIPTRLKSLFFFDRYERAERQALRRHLDPDLPVVELGGSIGVVACLANRRLHRPEQHVVVEASPDLVPLLEANRDRNGCHFRVLPRAIAYGQPEVEFALDDFLAGRVGGDGKRTVRVPTTSLREVLDRSGFERCTLICDIEGQEVDLVRQEADTLRSRVATLIVELHPRFTGEGRVREVLDTLRRLGFREVLRYENTYTLLNTG